MNSKVFTVHQPFTTYHYEIKNKNNGVNSVNSFPEKKFFLQPRNSSCLAVIQQDNHHDRRV
ncbi:hypothetical protein DN589_21660 [Klebsiella quasipneumoniae subsp. similipneumoniae]|nr:hypothetical protein DN589_21660 [Klebsiella quasipneumoniae subsp. similipneumoniae]